MNGDTLANNLGFVAWGIVALSLPGLKWLGLSDLTWGQALLPVWLPVLFMTGVVALVALTACFASVIRGRA